MSFPPEKYCLTTFCSWPTEIVDHCVENRHASRRRPTYFYRRGPGAAAFRLPRPYRDFRQEKPGNARGVGLDDVSLAGVVGETGSAFAEAEDALCGDGVESRALERDPKS